MRKRVVHTLLKIKKGDITHRLAAALAPDEERDSTCQRQHHEGADHDARDCASRQLAASAATAAGGGGTSRVCRRSVTYILPA